MVGELNKIMADTNHKKKVNMNKQITLNAQIFKQNLEIISNTILSMVFNELYNPADTNTNSVVNSNVNTNVNINDPIVSSNSHKLQLQSNLLESQLINSTSQQL